MRADLTDELKNELEHEQQLKVQSIKDYFIT